MSLDGLLAQRCIVIHVGDTGTDRYNNPERGETSRDTDVHTRFEQLSAEELTIQRDTAGATHLAFFLPDQTLGPFDQVELNSVTYEITGPPDVVYGATEPHHLEVLLRSSTDWT